VELVALSTCCTFCSPVARKGEDEDERQITKTRKYESTKKKNCAFAPIGFLDLVFFVLSYFRVFVICLSSSSLIG